MKHLPYVKEQSLLISKNLQSREGRAGCSDKLANRNQPVTSEIVPINGSNRAILLSAQIHADDTVQPVRPRPSRGPLAHGLIPWGNRDPFLPWAPAFAGVTTFLLRTLVRRRLEIFFLCLNTSTPILRRRNFP